jgi:hypothetical protein
MMGEYKANISPCLQLPQSAYKSKRNSQTGYLPPSRSRSSRPRNSSQPESAKWMQSWAAVSREGASPKLRARHRRARHLSDSAIASITQSGAACAWVDVSDALSPESAAAANIVLKRLLWLRMSAERKQQRVTDKPWSRLEQALKAR